MGKKKKKVRSENYSVPVILSLGNKNMWGGCIRYDGEQTKHEGNEREMSWQ